ncbi:MAG: glycosyltransferase family 4 protein [Bacteroidetes bacterium]|nr:glycosyltransferase family 4 protein [Bacteroidota bacterium]MBU1679197.1 glycosyltransferase family 4 protein [Bacteroidota bacterium]
METVLADNLPTRLMFLCMESPCPAISGGTLRTLGLLKELNKSFEIELVVLSRQPLSGEQIAVLREYSDSIVQVSMKFISIREKLKTLWHMFISNLPYHCAIIDISFREYPEILHKILNYQGIVYASYGHWGTLIRDRQSPNWILDQHNADIEFWRVYASQASNYLVKLMALVNWHLANKHFRQIYACVGRIISVCKEDKQLTLAVSPNAKVDIIENGVDCSYYFPNRVAHSGHPRLLFTGTSAARNMTALHKFVRNVFPLIQQKLSDVELLVGGNFHSKAQSQFKGCRGIRFTGRVNDIRPIFNDSDVYISPFDETHGSKLKIAEAMAMGMAIVSTHEGIRGFPLVDGKSVLVAYSNEQFASLAVDLLTDSVRREIIGKEARKVAEMFIDWKVLGKRLVQIINSVYKEN